MSEQLPFRLPFQEARGAQDLFVSSSNSTAIAWLDRWPDWPHYALALWGPEGCGKTHLAHVWQKNVKAQFTDFPIEPVEKTRLIIDFSSFTPLSPVEEQQFLHFLNACQQQDCALLILSRDPPARWPIALADLSSRLNAIPTVKIDEPDDALLRAVLAKHFQDRQFPVLDEVISYLVKRIDRSFASAAQWVERIDRFQLKTKRPFNIALVRDALKEEKDIG